MKRFLRRLDRRRLAISLAAGLVAGALTAAIAIPANTPSMLQQARDAAPTADGSN